MHRATDERFRLRPLLVDLVVHIIIVSGVALKNEVGEREVGERLEIEVTTVAKSAILQEFCLV